MEVSFEEDIRFPTVLSTLISQFLTLHTAIREKEELLLEENRSLKARLHGRHDGHFIIGHSSPCRMSSASYRRLPRAMSRPCFSEIGDGKGAGGQGHS